MKILSDIYDLDKIPDGTSYQKVSAEDRTLWNNKQDNLVSGQNIKTINSQSILGSGDVTIGGSSYQYNVLLCTSDNKLKLTDTTTKNNVIDLLNKYVNSLNGEILFEQYGITADTNDINKKFKIIKIAKDGTSSGYYIIRLDVLENTRPTQMSRYGVDYSQLGASGYYRVYVSTSEWDAKVISAIRTNPSSETLTDISLGGAIYPYSLSNVTSILGIRNSTAFTPTEDYQPATKKYVDDTTAAIEVPTKTSDLTNDSGFISSIPNAASSTVGGIKVRYDSTTSTLYITNDGSDA